MNKVQFEEMFPWELERAIHTAPLAYLPLGTLEWHGEHNAVGLDALKAHAICVRAAQLSGGVVVPPLYWATDSREDLPDGSYLTGGVELGERYHVPGNMFWLRPETYLALLFDLYEAMHRRGIRAIVVLCGHWSRYTLSSVQTSGAMFVAAHPDCRWLTLTDRELVPDLHYPHEHAAGGETSILMALRPDLVDLSKTLETAGVLRDFYAGLPTDVSTQHLCRRQETTNKYIGVLRGEEGEGNDPELTASPERGRELLEIIASRLAAQALVLLD